MPFLNNFNAMEVTLTEDQSKLLNNITTVKQGAKSQSWEIDAITGATITSRAVGNILNVSAQQWLPHIIKNIDSFTKNKSAG